jgi:hypothetical protein
VKRIFFLLALVLGPAVAYAQPVIPPGAYTCPAPCVITIGNPPPVVSVANLAVSPTSLAGGASATGTVTLGAPAAAGGLTVALASSNAAAKVPASIVVAAGSTSGKFTVTTSAVAAATSVVLTATLNGSATATLAVNPAVSGNVVAWNPGQIVTDPIFAANTTYTTAGCADDGKRVSLADVPNMATVKLSATAVLPGGSKLLCLNVQSVGYLRHQFDETGVDGITFAKVVMQADPTAGSRRAIANGNHLVLRDSYVWNFFDPNGADSQCYAGWDNDGPVTITNNYLACWSENIMFGGSDPSKQGRVPSNIEVSGNLVEKPVAWMSIAGRGVKNLFELKNASNVHVANNTFTGNWGDAQNGIAILFTVRNENGTCRWCVVQHVVFENNVVDNAGGGVNLLGSDNLHPSATANDIIIRNNQFHRITWNMRGDGRTIQILAGPPCTQNPPPGWSNPPWFCTGAVQGLQIIGNTDDSDTTQKNSLVLMDSGPTPNVVFTGNDMTAGQHFFAAPGIVGPPTIPMWMPGVTMTGNHFRGPAASCAAPMPAGNVCSNP